MYFYKKNSISPKIFLCNFVNLSLLFYLTLFLYLFFIYIYIYLFAVIVSFITAHIKAVEHIQMMRTPLGRLTVQISGRKRTALF